MILKFSQFLNETLDILKTDAPGLISQKNYLNDLQKNLQEFGSKKSLLDRIYVEYKSDNELLMFLKNNGFVEKNISDVREIKFINPIFSIYYRVSEKMRQINELNKTIDDLNKKIDEKIKTSKTDTNNDQLKTDIESVRKEMIEKNKQLEKLKNEIAVLKNTTESKVQSLKTEFQKLTNDVRKRMSEK